MKINMKSANATLATQGTYCPEDVEIAVALQEKTAAANGEVVPDSGYAGLGKVVVAVPDPDAVIIDVTALPTEDVDPDAYYRMDGKLYKKPDTAVGTWVLKETMTPTTDGGFAVGGTCVRGVFNGITIVSAPTSGTSWVADRFYIRFYNEESNPVFLGAYFVKKTIPTPTQTAGYLVTVPSGISPTYLDPIPENRTFTITGGTDAKNSDLVAWLKANAVRTKLGDDWDCYLVPSGSVEITENGTVDVTEYASVTVGTPTGAEITQTGTTVRIG